MKSGKVKVNPNFKEVLKENQLWGEFVRRRGELMKYEGMSSAEAKVKVIEDIAPELLGGGDGDESVSGVSGFGGNVKGGLKALSKKLDAKVFAGRSCSLPAAFMWAFSHLSIRGVRPKDAPSPAAWQIYVEMNLSTAVRTELLTKCLVAEVRKAELEDNGGSGDFDGKKQYDILGAIAEGKAG